MIPRELLYSRVLLKYKKGQRKLLDIDIRRGTESAPPSLVLSRPYILLSDLLQDSIYLKVKRLELTIERSYQTHSHNILLKITRLVRRFLLRRNMSLSKIHCYID